MNRQQEIEAFLLLAHRAALCRLRDDPRRIGEALERVRRLSAKAGAERALPYYRRWQELLSGDPGALEAAVTADDDRGAALRSVSPLGFLLSHSERADLLAQVRAGR